MDQNPELARTINLADRITARRSHPSLPGRQPAATALEPGTTLGGYVILSKLGEGGMGVVYKAHDANLDRTVALKILPPHPTRNQEFMRRFRTEARAQARLSSANVVTLYSMMDTEVGLVLVMEYVEGQTLDRRLRNQGPLSVPDAIHVFEQALLGIDHAHQMGIVHRDLKPGNIFITTGRQVKLMDFGVARMLTHQGNTLAGSMIGTLLYISPEQINGRPADFRSDIYTLGVSLFEAVTGRLPFERKTDYAVMHAHVLENPPKPRALRRSVPRELEQTILHAIEKDPDYRFQSAREFRDALLRRGRSLPALIPSMARARAAGPWLKRRLLSGIGFDLALVALVGGLALGLGLHPYAGSTGSNRGATVADMATAAKPAAARTSKARAKPAKARRNRQPAAAQDIRPTATSTRPATRPAPPGASQDLYKSLRNAWGD